MTNLFSVQTYYPVSIEYCMYVLGMSAVLGVVVTDGVVFLRVAREISCCPWLRESSELSTY